MNRISEIRKVLIITLLLNIAVSASKVFYGYITNSVAIISDGFHSLLDGVSNIIGLAGIYLSSHPPDERHPYGHRKYETVFAIFIGIFMFVTCLEVLKKVYESFAYKRETVVTTASFLLMLVTMCINFFVSTYEKKKGEELKSEFLMADSMHTKNDIYVSLGVIASLIFIKIGVPIADPIAGLIVGIFIAKAGIDIIKESAEILVDRTQIDISVIKQIVCHVDGVVECHDVRTRGAKGNVFVDLHIVVNSSISVEDAHKIAHDVEERIKKIIPDIVDVIVHVEPSEGL